MDDTAPRDYFLLPACPSQRQYEALRAVFVEGLGQKDTAQRFGYRYGAFRQLVLQFRSTLAAGSPPPFSAHPHAAALPRRRPQSRPAPTHRPSRTHAV